MHNCMSSAWQSCQGNKNQYELLLCFVISLGIFAPTPSHGSQQCTSLFSGVFTFRYCAVPSWTILSQCFGGLLSETGRIWLVSNTELSEFFGPHRVPGRELSEFFSGYYLCAKPSSPSFFAELTEFGAELSEFSLLRQCS